VGTSPTSEGKRAFGELLREGGAKEDAPVEGEPKQLFKEQEGACPVLPSHLQAG
jgi:hypothetical protein